MPREHQRDPSDWNRCVLKDSSTRKCCQGRRDVTEEDPTDWPMGSDPLKVLEQRREMKTTEDIQTET